MKNKANDLGRKSLIERIDQLIGQAQKVIGSTVNLFPEFDFLGGSPHTVNAEAFSQWKNSAENFILRVATKTSSYYQNFTSQVRENNSDQVQIGAGVLRAVREDILHGVLPVETQEHVPTARSATINDLKNPHQEYWGMIWKLLWKYIKKPISKIVIGLIILALAAWLGLNR